MGERRDPELESLLLGLDGKGYGAYKAIRGRWQLSGAELLVDHVQGDPFAAPSRVRVILNPEMAGFPQELYRTGPRATGTSCYLARCFAEAAASCEEEGRQGSGRSGEIRIEAPGQEVIANTAVQLHSDGRVEARFRIGLPARGRRIMGRACAHLLLRTVPEVARRTLRYDQLDPEELRIHAEAAEDAEWLRGRLRERQLVAFVADGSVLPRRSGADQRPMASESAVPFRSPRGLRVEFALPNAGRVAGMGVPAGVTLIVGGGFHGKSTLLRALERGVYGHRPGDGRERVVTDPGAVKIRAEDGRSVRSVDISGFIGELPGGLSTMDFSTPDASGSTSQAAAIVEAMEAGARLLLVDEDTAATNFMMRDRRMQALVPGDREPIIPFVDRVRELYETHGISSILVIGGSGDYLDVADTVIAMADFTPSLVTDTAHDVARRYPTDRQREAPGPLTRPAPRRPIADSLDPSRGRRDVYLRSRGMREIHFGTEEIDLAAVEQVVSPAQARALSEAILLSRRRLDGASLTLPELLDAVMAELQEQGLDVLGHGHDGDLALFRRHELAQAINRIRSLRCETSPEPLP